MSYTAFTLDHVASGGGTTAVFRAGLTAQSHRWDIKAQSGSLLAHTARYHRGGKFAQAFWKFWNVIGMGAGDDIHVELVGAEGVQLGRATTGNWPAVVTVTDAAGQQVVRSKRKKDTFTVYDRDDQPIAVLQRDGDGPWPLRTEAGDVIGEVARGQAGAEVARPVGVGGVARRRARLRGIQQEHASRASARRAVLVHARRARWSHAVALALLPLLCGLTY